MTLIYFQCSFLQLHLCPCIGYLSLHKLLQRLQGLRLSFHQLICSIHPLFNFTKLVNYCFHFPIQSFLPLARHICISGGLFRSGSIILQLVRQRHYFYHLFFLLWLLPIRNWDKTFYRHLHVSTLTAGGRFCSVYLL